MLLIFWLLGLSTAFHVTDKTLWDLLPSSDYSFLVVESPTCGYCHKLKPIWEDLTHLYDGIQFLEIDGKSNPQIMKRLSISSFPSLFLFKGDEQVIQYKGTRDTTAFTNYLTEITGFQPQWPDTGLIKPNVTSTLNDAGNLLVFYVPWLSDEFTGYNSILKYLPTNSTFVIDTSIESNHNIVRQYRVNSHPMFIFHKDRTLFKRFTGIMTREELESWITSDDWSQEELYEQNNVDDEYQDLYDEHGDVYDDTLWDSFNVL